MFNRANPDEINYRKCKKNDFLKLHEVNKEGFEGSKTSLITFKVAERLHNDTIFLAEHKDKAVGYVWGMRSQVNPQEGWIRQIAVLKDYRRIRIAENLQKMCIESFKSMGGVRYIGLTVEPTNEGAIRLYKKLYFKIIEAEPEYETIKINGRSAIKDYYGPDKHRCIMIKGI